MRSLPIAVLALALVMAGATSPAAEGKKKLGEAEGGFRPVAVGTLARRSAPGHPRAGGAGVPRSRRGGGPHRRRRAGGPGRRGVLQRLLLRLRPHGAGHGRGLAPGRCAARAAGEGALSRHRRRQHRRAGQRVPRPLRHPVPHGGRPGVRGFRRARHDGGHPVPAAPAARRGRGASRRARRSATSRTPGRSSRRSRPPSRTRPRPTRRRASSPAAAGARSSRSSRQRNWRRAWWRPPPPRGLPGARATPVPLPSGETFYRLAAGGKALWALVAGRAKVCNVCHDIFFIVLFDEGGTVVGLEPITITKYKNVEFDERDVAFLRGRVVGRPLSRDIVFDPTVDAVSDGDDEFGARLRHPAAARRRPGGRWSRPGRRNPDRFDTYKLLSENELFIDNIVCANV